MSEVIISYTDLLFLLILLNVIVLLYGQGLCSRFSIAKFINNP